MILRPALARRAHIAARFIQTKASGIDAEKISKYSAKYLASIGQQTSQSQQLDKDLTETAKLTREQADHEAQQWIDTIQQLKQEFRDQGYSPSKMFAPPGSTDFDFFRDAPNSVDANSLWQPTETQLNQLNSLRGKPVPSKFDSTIEYLTKVIMRKGFKARAEKYMSQALYLVHLKTRQDPIALTKRVLEDMGPLVKLKRYTDGGARSEMIPVPLTEKQRIRQSWDWILEASKKRPSKDFSVRLAEELVSASKGNSPGFEKKVQQHKLGIVNRSYISMMKRK